MQFRHQVTSTACFVALSCGSARAAIQGMQRIASGLSAPIYATTAPGDPSRLFVAERSGTIRVHHLGSGVTEATPFLSIPGVITSGEGGLLGMAFHPNYANAGSTGFGKFYVNLTASNGGISVFSNYIREYSVTANPNVATLVGQQGILTFTQPQDNHNGGWIGFGPDNNLYIGTGDGGGSDDNDAGHTAGTGNAQDITSNFLGKMLRVNVNGDDFPVDITRNYAIPPTNPFKAGVGDPADDVGDDEIWSYGLRNPFRSSFDRQTGDLWIGDVGQGLREEIDFQPASSTGAENYGWRIREGLIESALNGGPKPPGNVDPVYDYNRNADAFGGTVVTGGYVYRGPDPSLQGKYFFLDSRNSTSTTDDNYWMFDPANPFGTVTNIDAQLIPDFGARQFPVSFAEDSKGNLYVLYLVSGEIHRIRTEGVVYSLWNNNADANWSAAANWLVGTPNAIDASAGFGTIITAPRTVTVNAPQTVGSIYFHSPFSYTLAGADAITMDVSTGNAVIDVANGNHTISAPMTLNDDLNINIAPSGSTLTMSGALTATGRAITKSGAGVVQFTNVRAAHLGVGAGTVRIIASGLPNDAAGTSVVQSLTVSSGALLDLTNNSMILDYSGSVGTMVDDTRQHIASGRLTTSSGTTDVTGLGYADNAALDEVKTTFAGQSVDPSSILIKFTYFGDTDLDGDVDVADLGTLATNWQSAQPWSSGDFDYNATVDVNDLGLLASNWQAGVGAPLGPESLGEALAALGLPHVSVPEPAAVTVAAAAFGLFRRRRRSFGAVAQSSKR